MEKRNKLAYTLEEAADALNLSFPTMQVLVNRVDFPSFQIGNRWIIPADALKRWLDDQTMMSCNEKAAGILITH